jgi:hypothetical protein
MSIRIEALRDPPGPQENVIEKEAREAEFQKTQLVRTILVF